MRTFILIPSYKDEEAVAKTVAAVKAQGDLVTEIIVEEDENGDGFTRNVNRGLAKVIRSKLFDYENSVVYILNQDCELLPGALASMNALLSKNPKAGLVGLKQLAKDREHITHGGTKDAFPAGVHEGGLKSKKDCNKSKKVPWVNFACVGIKGAVFLECGLLDESMKMFASDSDYSYTARARGWECWYCAEAEAVHEGGASRSSDSQQQKQMRFDMTQFRDKWLGSERYRDLYGEVFR